MKRQLGGEAFGFVSPSTGSIVVQDVTTSASIPAESSQQAVAAMRKEPDVGTHCHNPHPHVQPSPGVLLYRGEDTRRLPGSVDPGDGVIDGGHHFGIRGHSRVTQSGVEVGWPYEQHVDPFDLRNLLQVVEGERGLYLHHDTNLLVG